MLNQKNIRMLLEGEENDHLSFSKIERFARGVLEKGSKEYLEIEAHLKECSECKSAYSECKEFEIFDNEENERIWKKVWDQVEETLTEEESVLLDQLDELKKTTEEVLGEKMFNYYLDVESKMLEERKKLKQKLGSVESRRKQEIEQDWLLELEEKRTQIEVLLENKKRDFISDFISTIDSNLSKFNRSLFSKLIIARLIAG